MGQARRTRRAKAIAAKALNPQPPKGLLDLPPELRYMVYEYVLANDAEMTISKHGLHFNSSLGLTCHEIFHEFEPLYRARWPKLSKIYHIRIPNLDFAPFLDPTIIQDLANRWQRAGDKRRFMELNIELVFDGTNRYQRNSEKDVATAIRVLDWRLGKWPKWYRVTGTMPPSCDGFLKYRHAVSRYMEERHWGYARGQRELYHFTKAVVEEFSARGMADWYGGKRRIG